ncbi:MAG: hypothetical protein ACLRVU_09745 [Beduini sp.]|uniref:hypothetical protein n=1 Tax=Beduini sp. TaxID=1922300 RepID=UPI0039A329E3
MQTVKEKLIAVLETYGYPVILQGSLQQDQPYPEHFFSFYNNNTYSTTFYSNFEKAILWDFDVNFYSVDPSKTNAMLIEAKQKLKTNGFIIDGAGHDLISDEPSHTGRGITVLYVEPL